MNSSRFLSSSVSSVLCVTNQIKYEVNNWAKMEQGEGDEAESS